MKLADIHRQFTGDASFAPQAYVRKVRPHESRPRVRMAADVSTLGGSDGSLGAARSQERTATASLRKQGSGPYLKVLAATRAPTPARREHHPARGRFFFRIEGVLHGLGARARRDRHTSHVHDRGGAPLRPGRVGASRRAHHRLADRRGHFRAVRRRGPSDLVGERDEHPRPEVLPGHRGCARSRVVFAAGDRPYRRHDRRVGPARRLLRRWPRGLGLS